MTASHFRAPRRPSGRLGAAFGVLLLASTACGYPTEIPQVDQRWIVPPQVRTISVASLLPATIGIAPDSGAFTVSLAPATVTRPLSADCASCAAANGTTVPKPAFVATASAATPLPADIVSASLVAGSVQLDIRNGYNFDPLRPSATARGYAIVTITNGALTIARDSIDGAAVALPAGGALSRTLALTPGALSGASPLTVTIQLNSPAGDPVQMDASRSISATLTPGVVRVSSAQVSVVAREVTSSSTLDLRDIDATISDHVTGGALLFDIVNPFAVTGTITVKLTAGAVAPITRTIALAVGRSTPSVTLTGDELRSLSGRIVTLQVSGPVSQTAGAITVTPKQVVEITSRLDLTLHTGG
jgi:hypothetical protein